MNLWLKSLAVSGGILLGAGLSLPTLAEVAFSRFEIVDEFQGIRNFPRWAPVGGDCDSGLSSVDMPMLILVPGVFSDDYSQVQPDPDLVDPESMILLAQAASFWGFSMIAGMSYRRSDDFYDTAKALAQAIERFARSSHRIVIVAHDTGGLLARWALEKNTASAANVTDLVTLATPHNGFPTDYLGRFKDAVCAMDLKSVEHIMASTGHIPNVLLRWGLRGRSARTLSRIANRLGTSDLSVLKQVLVRTCYQKGVFMRGSSLFAKLNRDIPSLNTRYHVIQNLLPIDELQDRKNQIAPGLPFEELMALLPCATVYGMEVTPSGFLDGVGVDAMAILQSLIRSWSSNGCYGGAAPAA